MNTRNALASYKSVDLGAALAQATPHQQVSMLLNGALERIAQARGAMQTGNIELKGMLIGKAITIVTGLQSSLSDIEENEVSANLDRLYSYMYQQLLKANLENSEEKLTEVAALLTEIKVGWDEIPREYHHIRAEPAKVK